MSDRAFNLPNGSVRALLAGFLVVSLVALYAFKGEAPESLVTLASASVTFYFTKPDKEAS